MTIDKDMQTKIDGIKTVFQGALGALTFGAYHQFTTNKIMEMNNEKQDFKLKQIEERNKKLEKRNRLLEESNHRELEERNKLLQDEIAYLKKRWWF